MVAIGLAFIQTCKAQNCASNEVYTSSCSYCEESCYPWRVKCGFDLNPGCTSGQAKCICPAGFEVARDACGGCQNRTICPKTQECPSYDAANCAEQGKACNYVQICIRASALNYGQCVPNTTETTMTPEPTFETTTAVDPCENVICSCGEMCWATGYGNGTECVPFGACYQGLDNCTEQLCNDTGMSTGTPPNCHLGFVCQPLPTEPTQAPVPTTTHYCPSGQRFLITFLNNRAGQCLPEDTIDNPCKYLRCQSGFVCATQAVAGCPCCNLNARCLPSNSTHYTSAVTQPITTSTKAPCDPRTRRHH
ncbi:hypothetical protein L596_013826 [Steinernema carpocapsae]|uniref:TIL domain-containing protein n=1 Tax=Steinernema carpocapsae TaxID=34508 RepID=A0A4V6A596_STECR|nr:hypothetical protein L596_013826 [Steinernema carpocapsae]